MELGIQIKQRRQELSLTQQDLAELLNVSRSAISNWEIGKNYPDIQSIINLSDILDISIEKLLKGDSELVEQITNDTKSVKKLNKKIKFLYFLIFSLCIIIFVGIYKTIEYSDIKNPDYIQSLTLKNQSIHAITDLPFYRSLVAYSVNKSADGTYLEVDLISKLDLSMKNNNELDIPVNNLMNEKLNRIDCLYGGEILKSFPIE